MRLSKIAAKAHQEACALLEKDVLTLDEREFVLDNWHEGAEHINSVNAAFFTPFGLARDLSIYVGEGSVIDLCAGIGALAFHAIDRFHFQRSPKRVVCVELNPAYVAVGRKVVPEATWICGSVFDLPSDLGTFDCAISNPPFGRSKDVPLSGVTLDLNVVAVAAKLARRGVFILPQESCPFEYSGRQGYADRESKPYSRLRKSVDVVLRCSSVDCGFHRNSWRNVSPQVEIAYFDLDEQELEAEAEKAELIARLCAWAGEAAEPAPPVPAPQATAWSPVQVPLFQEVERG